MVRRLPTAMGLALVLVLTFALGASARPVAPEADPDAATGALRAGQVDFRLVVGGLTQPLGVTNAGDGTNRLFVVQQNGIVRVVANGQLQPGAFLDVRNAAGGFTTGGERGLLGLAFHPSFESNRKLYAYYTQGDGDLIIAEFTANAARTGVDVGTRAVLLDIEHSSQANHNGGQLAFGPDGNLYIFTGDGGGSGDPGENAQNLSSLLGKALRIRPNTSGGYTIPSGNPFAGSTPGRDEIWAYGLRNPWRASFDRANGNLWIADVGQGSYEEINRVSGSAAGRNYMWDRCEGRHLFEGPGPCDTTSGAMTAPIIEYSQAPPRSVVGGHVYRGSQQPDLPGHYIYADFYSGKVWTVPAGGSSPTFHRDTTLNIASFGESESGEIYAVDLIVGRLFQVVTAPFNDIASSQFFGDIVWIADKGITSGCGGGRYCPDQAVNREQMASFIARAMNLPPAGRDFFNDDGGSIHQGDINRLAQAGIATGCGGGRYCPRAPVTRQEMASFLARALDLPAASRDFFTDDGGSIHQGDINRVAQAGIASGCGGGRYCPLLAVTRGEMAAFIRRSFD